MGPRVLQLVAIGNAPLSLLRELEAPLTAQLGLTVGYGKPALASPAYAFNKDRNQYHSNAIMRRLVPLLDREGTVLGVTDVDLFVPDSPFVFGEADRESRVAILSGRPTPPGRRRGDLPPAGADPGPAPGGASRRAELLRGRALRDVRRDLAGGRGPPAAVALPHLPQRAGEAGSLSDSAPPRHFDRGPSDGARRAWATIEGLPSMSPWLRRCALCLVLLSLPARGRPSP